MPAWCASPALRPDVVAGLALLVALAAIAVALMAQFRRTPDGHERLLLLNEELRRAQQDTLQAMRWLKLAERIAHVGHWHLALPGLENTWSDEVYRIYGVQRGVFEPDLENGIAAYHPDDRHIVRDAVTRAIDTGEGFEILVRLVRPTGELRHVVSRGVVRLDSDGEAEALFGVFLDVTEQKAIEAQLRAAIARAESLVRHDSATGLANRQHFDTELTAEIGRAADDGTPVGVIIVEVDHFTNYLAQYGRLEADACLQCLATLISRCANRPGDLVARFCDARMAVLLPGADGDAAGMVAEHIVRAVRDAALPHTLSPFGRVTVSAGAKSCIPGFALRDGRQILHRADLALGAAITAGRGRAVSYAAMHKEAVLF